MIIVIASFQKDLEIQIAKRYNVRSNASHQRQSFLKGNKASTMTCRKENSNDPKRNDNSSPETSQVNRASSHFRIQKQINGMRTK